MALFNFSKLIWVFVTVLYRGPVLPFASEIDFLLAGMQEYWTNTALVSRYVLKSAFGNCKLLYEGDPLAIWSHHSRVLNVLLYNV